MSTPRAAADRHGPHCLIAFLVIALAATAAAWPALRGGWVYDDQILPGHPLIGGLRDAVRAFRRNSGDYLAGAGTADPLVSTAVTYRPLPMASFALTAALAGPSPLAHHLVSLCFYLGLVLAALCLAARRGRLGWAAALLVAAFAFHPSLTESWQWINGRSDVMAALALAVLALVRRGGPPRLRGLDLFPILMAGAFCKETFLVAAAALLLAEAIAEPSAHGGVKAWLWSWPTLLAWCAAAATFWCARLATLHGPTALPRLLSPRGLLGHGPRLLALATDTLAVPLPRPMRLLSWELSRPWTAARLAVLLAVVAVVGLLVRGRHWRPLVLVLGAMATVAPAVALAEGFWLGFDRYLVQPALLLLLAALPAVDRWRPSPRAARVAAGAAALLLVGLVAASRASARFYVSHPALCAAMIEARPEDPTGYLMGALDALQRDDRARARLLLARTPRANLPPAHLHRLVRLDLQLGRVEDAASTVELAAPARPDDARLAMDLLLVRVAQRRWPEVLAAAAEAARRWPERRRQLGRLLAAVAAHAPDEVAGRLRGVVPGGP